MWRSTSKPVTSQPGGLVWACSISLRDSSAGHIFFSPWRRWSCYGFIVLFFSFFFPPFFFYSLFDITTCSSAFRMTRPMGLMTVRIYRRWEQKIITDYRSGSFLARQLEVEDISFLIVHLGPDSLYLCTRRDCFKSSLPSVPDKSISSQRPYSNPTACYM